MQDMKSKIMELVTSGDLSSAKRLCQNACKAEPANAELLFILSAICGQQNDFEGAERNCKKVLKLNSYNPSTYYNLAIAQRRLGKSEEAVSSHQQAIKVQPQFMPSYFELGNISVEQEHFEKAIEYYDVVIKAQPEAFQVITAKATALFKSGHKKVSAENLILSSSINPAQPEVYSMLATISEDNREIDKAIEYSKKALEYGSDFDNDHINLARLYAINQAYQDSENQYKKFLSMKPDNIAAIVGLGLLYNDMQRYEEALETINKVQGKEMDNAHFLYNYAMILSSNNRYSEAIETYKRSLELQPDLAEAMINMGNIYLLSGKASEAQILYRSAYNIVPQNQDAASNMLMSLNYTDDVSIIDCIAMHGDWASTLQVTGTEFDISNRLPNPRLRIGYVSPDFRKHSVAYFFDAILSYSDTKRVKNYCYSNTNMKDDVTEKLKNKADVWVDVYTFSDDVLAARIYDDNIDVLVDLTGHMAGNRLRVFAMKPAPVQMTYLGYPNTTGLNSIDFRLVDRYTDPEDSSDNIPEKRLYLDPSFLCYSPVDDCPEVSELPAIANGYITFGSFNNLAKITDDVFDVWAELLRVVPDSKLCIKARQYADDNILEDHMAQFKRRGVQVNRLIFIKYSDTVRDHLQCYNRIDIALDTFPYNGTTTTLEALWMGVPVVALSGNCHAARVGVSILNNIGRPQWIGLTSDEYLDIAKNMALESGSLKVIRQELRDMVRASPVNDREHFVKQFESILLTNSHH